MENGTSFFRNTSCAHFPCHEDVNPQMFNCLFCYCPLYALGPACGGRFSYTGKGIKDCTKCTKLHDGDKGVSIVREKFSLLADLAREAKWSSEGPDRNPGEGPGGGPGWGPDEGPGRGPDEKQHGEPSVGPGGGAL